VKPPAFVYHSPASLDEALDVLAEAGPDGKVLAGGQSLIPLLNMRLAAPRHVVDINRLTGLDTVEVSADGVRVGALARHARVERSRGAAAVQPLLGQALRHVAHPVIRNRGTVVGSLAHADPAAELPVVLALLGGAVEVARAAPPGGTPAAGSAGSADTPGATASGRPRRRTVAAADFFAGPLEPALEPGELAVSAFFPALPPRSATAFAEVSRRHGDFALAGVAGLVTVGEGGRVTAARVGLLGLAATPLVLDLTAVAADHADPRYGAAGGDWRAVAAWASERVEPEADIHASADYRRHLAGVLTERVLRIASRSVR
jgi:CO/xanthine dehydrogenase FAD-binding subunit